MMVNPYDDSRLLLALQVDHSRVAGFLAAHWGNAMFSEPKPFSSVVLAAQEHDNGWGEWEIKPSTLNDQGYPLDYHDGSLKYLGKFRLDFYKDGVNQIVQRDPYAGLLVLMHGVGLMNGGYGRFTYPPDRMGNPLVKEYVDDQEKLRVKLLDELRGSEEFREFVAEEKLWANYELMTIFDQLGQFICNRYPLNNSEARKQGPHRDLNNVPVPLGAGGDHVKLTIDPADEKNATVRPYPFDLDPLVVTFPARLVPKRSYADPEDFLKEFYKAERITVSCNLHAG